MEQKVINRSNLSKYITPQFIYQLQTLKESTDVENYNEFLVY